MFVETPLFSNDNDDVHVDDDEGDDDDDDEDEQSCGKDEDMSDTSEQNIDLLED